MVTNSASAARACAGAEDGRGIRTARRGAPWDALTASAAGERQKLVAAAGRPRRVRAGERYAVGAGGDALDGDGDVHVRLRLWRER